MPPHRHKSLGSSRPPADSARPPRSGVAIPEDALLDAAREAILAVGWSRTTLTDIARRAGVSRMTIYRKWPDTQSLLADLMTREWSASLIAAQETGDPLADLVSTMLATLRAVRANPLLRKIIDVDPHLLLPYLLDRRGRSQELVLGLVESQIRAGQKAGTIRRGKPATLARAVVLAAHGFTLSAHTMLEGLQDRDADVRAFDKELATIVERYLSA